ncbi:MAG TPA: hypothetical protein VK983_03425 [Candidatus Limnocylindrales bacterium]|nr:hypothetical protein [Candidatus Limnocylindrales bacterium]
MALEFELERTRACERRNAVYATPYVRRGWNSAGRLDSLYLGDQLPDITAVPELVTEVMKGLAKRGDRADLQAGLMAIDVLNLCDNDHSERPKVTKRGPHQLERVGALVLARDDNEAFGVKAVRHAGEEVQLVLDPPIAGTGPVRPAVMLEATAEEQLENPIDHAIRSVPFGKRTDVGFVALRGHEIIHRF